MREIVSTPPPEPAPTIMRIGFAGKVCAEESSAATASAAATPNLLKRLHYSVELVNDSAGNCAGVIAAAKLHGMEPALGIGAMHCVFERARSVRCDGVRMPFAQPFEH